jgi:hypothetical protein
MQTNDLASHLPGRDMRKGSMRENDLDRSPEKFS